MYGDHMDGTDGATMGLWMGLPLDDVLIGLGRMLKHRPRPNTYRSVQPGEIYLRLIHTDLDDDASVEDFIGRYGMMGLHELKGRYAGLSPAHEVAGDARPEPDDPLRARRWRARNALTLDRDAFKDGEESFDEFLGAAYLLRDAYTLWRCFNEGLDTREQPLDLVDADEFGFGEIPDHYVWRWTLDVLNMIFEGALAPFSPRLISIGRRVDLPGGVKPRRETPWEFEPLYSILFLGLFNHISAGARYRICANDRCRQPFVRQEGRAKKGSSRSTGTLYCSAACARAVAVRAYRERKRRAPKEGGA
jgi:hypothetical protein